MLKSFFKRQNKPPKIERQSLGIPKKLGDSCEEKVRRFLIEEGWRILAVQKKVAGVEVDLIVRDPQGQCALVEVKSLSPQADLAYRLSSKQKQRLFWAREIYQNLEGERVEFILALVERERGILLMRDFS